jgi:hypothetical protein
MKLACAARKLREPGEHHCKEANTMHTVELLDQAIRLATDCGFVVRQDWFGGSSAGACEYRGRRWIFIDLALSPAEQLGQVVDALRAMPVIPPREMPPQLSALLNRRQAA